MRLLAAVTTLLMNLWACGLAGAQTIVQAAATSQVSQLAGESPLGQSFTATRDGVVTAIGVRSMNDVTATLRIYHGGTGSGVPNDIGTPAYTQAGVGLTAAAGVGAAFGFSQVVLATPFPVVAGQQYTFQLTATNPFSLAAQFGNPYPGGVFVSIYGAVPFPGSGLDAAFQVFEVEAPEITSVAVPPAGNYATGLPLVFTVTWNEPVFVTGTPFLALGVGATTRNAAYVSGSGTSTLTFTYLVDATDRDDDGITLGGLDLNGGSIRNAVLDGDTMLNGVGPTTGVLVNSPYVVTPVAGPNGAVTPASPQAVAPNGSIAITATPNAGYSTAWTGSTCPGTPSGNTFTAGPITADCTVAASFTLNSYTVTPGAGANGSIAPNTPQAVSHGGTRTFTATPGAGYSTAWTGSTCPGTPSGNTFTAGPVTASCSVVATFTLNSYTVTPGAGSNGSIAPNAPQAVSHGGMLAFTATPAAGYRTAWTGSTCPGTPSGNTFTAGPITANCTVNATFSQVTFTVTPAAGSNGSIAPAVPQVVAQNGTIAFAATPSSGYSTAWSATCPGAAVGDVFYAGPVTADCTVSASFTLVPVRTYTGPSPTGSGTITASFTGGGTTCTFGTSQFIPVTGHSRSPPGAPPATFPHGLFDFTTTSCSPGSAITMTITYPQALPPEAHYYKYGPTPANPAPHWYVLPATLAGNTATFTITDGGLGDDDLVANGTFVDQGGPGVGPAANPIPTMGEWMLMVMASLMLLLGMRRLAVRRRS